MARPIGLVGRLVVAVWEDVLTSRVGHVGHDVDGPSGESELPRPRDDEGHLDQTAKLTPAGR